MPPTKSVTKTATKSMPKTTTKTTAKPAGKNADKASAPAESVSPEQELLHAILCTAELMENRLGRVLRDSDLSTSQYHAMRVLRDSGESMPSLEVAGRMPQVAPAITRIVEQLVGRGLMERQQSTDDGRVFLISLTAEGKRLMKKLDGPVQKLHASILTNVARPELKKISQSLLSMIESMAY